MTEFLPMPSDEGLADAARILTAPQPEALAVPDLRRAFVWHMCVGGAAIARVTGVALYEQHPDDPASCVLVALEAQPLGGDGPRVAIPDGDPLWEIIASAVLASERHDIDAAWRAHRLAYLTGGRRA